MSGILLIVQLVVWLGTSFYLISAFSIEHILAQVLVFGVIGIVTAGVISGLAVKLGILNPQGDPNEEGR